MAAIASHLADTSALSRLRNAAVAAVLAPLIEAGLVATCGVIEFELGWATRNGDEFDEVRADRDAGYEWLPTHDEDWRRALDVQSTLWRHGRVRAVGFPGLLIGFSNNNMNAKTETESSFRRCCQASYLGNFSRNILRWFTPRE